MNVKNIPIYLRDVLFVKINIMNIMKKINVKLVNMDILKQKKKNAFIVDLKNMVVLVVMNVDTK